jgi:hypothetical protein
MKSTVMFVSSSDKRLNIAATVLASSRLGFDQLGTMRAGAALVLEKDTDDAAYDWAQQKAPADAGGKAPTLRPPVVANRHRKADPRQNFHLRLPPE